jgi:hypothetical protein
MPLPIMLAHKVCRRLAGVRKAEQLKYLRPDGKAQVTIRYEVDDLGRQRPVEIVRVLVSTQHADGVDAQTIKEDVIEHVLHPVLPRELYDERRFGERDFVYVDLKDAIPLLESLVQLSGTQTPAQVSDNLRPLQSFTAWATRDGDVNKFTLFLEIK